MVVVETEFSCVAGKDEILLVVVCDQYSLAPIGKRVQIAIRVLFLLVEENEIELVLVRQTRAEQTHAPVGVVEK